MVFKWMDGTKPLNWPTTGAVILECQKIPIHTMILIPMHRLKRRMQLLLCPIWQPPVPITQHAWLLHSILCQDPAGNDSILQALSMASPASSSVPPLSSESLKHDGLAHLAGHLAIEANVLAQRRAASSEIPDDHST